MNIKSKINKILNNKIYVDFIKIGVSIFFYIITISIFKAGYDYQSVIELSTKKEEEKIKRYSYEVKINNNSYKTIKFNEDKTLFSLINSIEGLNVEYISYYEGKEIISINGNKNFRLILNDTQLTSNFYRENDIKVPEKSFIQVYY